jgi:LysM repeat protein
LGRHSKTSRIRIPRRLAIAAAPALAGVGATLCLSPQALANPSPSQPAAAHAVTAAAVTRLGPSSTQLLAAIERAAQHASGTAQASSYTVRPGDSLSAIAGRAYHNQNAWPVLYWANRSKIRWANLIEPGQVLQIPAEPARIPSPPGQLGPSSAPASDPASAPAAQVAAPSASPAADTSQSAARASSATYTGGTPGGSFGQCVVARESGGNAQVMNASGHYGLYQFSASTWAEYGGSAADFGNASVGEQNQVFANALAAGGQSNWSPYDGC